MEQRVKNERFAATSIMPIPSYWSIALKSFEFAKAYIKDKDELILRYLVSINANFPDEYSFEIKFEFKVIRLIERD